MDTTDCLDLPFPSCDPPFTKDASDIIQFKALADATDTAVQALADAVDNTLSFPDTCCMVGGVTVAGNDVVHFYGGTTRFDNAGMANSVLDLIEIQQTGWYMIGGWVSADIAPPSTLAIRVEPLRNGDAFSSRQGPGFVMSPDEAIAWTDVAFFNEGDLLNCMTHHTGSAVASVAYTTDIWALLVLANV